MIPYIKEKFDALVFTGGKCPQASCWLPFVHHQTLIIAADSGLQQLQTSHIQPHHIIGDFDSLQHAPTALSAYPQAKIHRYDKAKDETDTELALILAKDLGAKHILLIGGGEGRLDHLLAITQLFRGDLAPSAWLSAQELILPIYPGKPFVLSNIKNRTLSIFPIITPKAPIQTTGLLWPFKHFNALYSHMSLSNIAQHEQISISLEDGLLLLILPNVEAL